MQWIKVYRLCFNATAKHFSGAGDQLLLPFASVVRSEHLVTRQLAVDTHGYTDFAMALSRMLGFDLCPRLKELKQRHLFLPRGMPVPPELAAVCKSDVNIELIESHWDSLVNLGA